MMNEIIFRPPIYEYFEIILIENKQEYGILGAWGYLPLVLREKYRHWSISCFSPPHVGSGTQNPVFFPNFRRVQGRSVFIIVKCLKWG